MTNRRSLYLKNFIVIFSDIFLFTLSFIISVSPTNELNYIFHEFRINIIISYLIFFIIFYFSGIYENVIRYLNINFILKLSLNIIFLLAINIFTSIFLSDEKFIEILIPQLSIFFFLIITLRLLARNFIHNRES